LLIAQLALLSQAAVAQLGAGVGAGVSGTFVFAGGA
jgi:hypothetical protein